ncbi:hypothetical protein C8T65DRAFT_813442 [Cerioporus squamosus]|nr:hypothetical protein C8T65DRAFT_813442 [Cerioporus squamosus]
MSSPIRSKADAIRKGVRRREAKRAAAQEARDKEERQHKRQTLVEALAHLEANDLTFGDLVHFVSDPDNWQGNSRYRGFFSVPGRVEQVLNWWASGRNSDTGRGAIHNWAVEYVKRIVYSEGNQATKSRFLQSQHMDVDRNFALGFSLSKMYERLTELCPTAMSIFRAFSTTARQEKNMSPEAARRKENVCTFQMALTGLNARSQKNNLHRQVLGVYAYAEGAKRQLISVMSHLGLTSSYPTLSGQPAREAATAVSDSTAGMRSGEQSSSEPTAASESVALEGNTSHEGRTQDASGGREAGLLKLLGRACLREARERARNSVLAHVWDNVNFMFKVAEQVLGSKDSQQNGTCATVFELFDAKPEDMQTSDLIDSFMKAPPLSIDDILLSDAENAALAERLEHTVLRIIVTYGGEGFARFRKEVLQSTPTTPDKIPVHQTDPMPLPAMHIDESSTTGNADVLTEIFKELEQDMSSPEFARYVKLICGDQLSISRIRSLMTNRAGHDSFAQSFLWAVCMPGLFHYKMAATHGLLELHFGTSIDVPGSLWHQNTRLDRKPIVLTSLPPFRTCRDLIFVSLYARVLHCLELVSECASLDEYAEKVTLPELRAHAKAIMRAREGEDTLSLPTQDAENTAGTEEASGPEPTTGDTVFENAVLFLRDALVLREFTDAIKAGDSGRVLTVLKLWTAGFRGSGRTKYAHEMLHLIHNLEHVWPEPLRCIVLQNWLVNPTGEDDSWVEVDLLQEHLNLWTKAVYEAHGSNASWEWLAMITPTIEVLRRLTTQMHKDLGSRQGTKHTSPDLQRDIAELMRVLSDDGVYTVRPGRTVDGSKGTVPNAVGLGWTQLTGPLADFNRNLSRLQSRCRMSPVVGQPYAAAASRASTPAPSLIPPSNAAASGARQEPVQGSTEDPSLAAEVDLAMEDMYWADGNNIDWELVGEKEDFFTLDTAADVALDMDDLNSLL